MLPPALREERSPASLKSEFEAMYSGYAKGSPRSTHFDPEFSSVDWPGKQPGDVGWAYVGIEGDGFLEAVAVTVASIDGRLHIREIEWGRP